MDDILIRPVGYVKSPVDDPDFMPLGGQEARIEILPEYAEALLHLEENSHVWIISWFHKAARDMLRTAPMKMDPAIKEYGVFALRSFARPNPIGLSLAKLIKVQKNIVYVKGLDAVNETPVLDIKPYFENDSIFSPVTSYIRGKERGMRWRLLHKRAVVHHREDCRDLNIAVRMAVIAEEVFGHLNADDLKVAVYGSSCLADSIQGLTRARLSNPVRFSFIPENGARTEWNQGNRELVIVLKGNLMQCDINLMSDEELFIINEG